MMRRALALVMVVGCATTGGKLGAAGAVVAGVTAAASFNFCLDLTITTDDGTYRDSCPSNATSAVFAVIAAAAAATAIGFEVAHVIKGDGPAERPRPASLPGPLPPANLELPPALSYAEARELVRQFVVARELSLDGRDASSHFDRASGAWIFEWAAGAGGVTLSVDVTRSVRGTRCEPDYGRDCSPIR